MVDRPEYPCRGWHRDVGRSGWGGVIFPELPLADVAGMCTHLVNIEEWQGRPDSLVEIEADAIVTKDKS